MRHSLSIQKFYDEQRLTIIFVVVLDWGLEVLAEGGSGHKGHRLAWEFSYTAPRCARKVLSENNIFGRTSVHKSGTARSSYREMPRGSRSSLSCRQGIRHGWVSFTKYHEMKFIKVNKSVN